MTIILSSSTDFCGQLNKWGYKFLIYLQKNIFYTILFNGAFLFSAFIDCTPFEFIYIHILELTSCLQFPDEVQTVSAFGLLWVKNQSNYEGDDHHDVNHVSADPVQPFGVLQLFQRPGCKNQVSLKVCSFIIFAIVYCLPVIIRSDYSEDRGNRVWDIRSRPAKYLFFTANSL